MRLPALAALLLFLTLPLRGPALEPAASPDLAVVRIKSHGCSATVIATAPGRSWLLGCGHMLGDPDTQRLDYQALAAPLKIDGPAQPYAPARLAAARVVAYDLAADLSLVQVENGPWHFVPVAPPGHAPGALWSCGYDEMRWPITVRAATVVGRRPGLTVTREPPWHGRSGGGLIDVEHRVLVGVVSAYTCPRGVPEKGLYVAHDAILKFLGRHRDKFVAPAPPAGDPGLFLAEGRGPAPAPPPRWRPAPPPMLLLPGPPGCPT